MDERLNFLFLTEAEAVQAGAGNMPRCIEVMEEVFSLLGQGDYLMGSPNRNSHPEGIYRRADSSGEGGFYLQQQSL